MMILSDHYDEFIQAKENGDPAAVAAYAHILGYNAPYVPGQSGKRLYLSDLGSCPRKVMYRLLGAPKKYESPATAKNKRLMFELGNHIERNLVAACEWGGILVDYQFRVSIPDRENWGGRGDLIVFPDTPTIVEVKTTRSNGLSRDHDYHPDEVNDVVWLNPDTLPYGHQAYQTISYQMHCEKDEGYHPLASEPILWQADRGGANPSREWHLRKPLLDIEYPHIAKMMDEFDYYRAEILDDYWETPGVEDFLPPVLPKVVKASKKKRGSNPPLMQELKEEVDPRCGYCDYAKQMDDSGACPCKMGTTIIAKREDAGDWNFNGKEDVEKVKAWNSARLPVTV